MRKIAVMAAVAVSGLGLALVPSALAGAAVGTCSGTFSGGTINGSLTVESGHSCTLTNETVNGSVTVKSDASLTTRSATINGSVVATKALFLDLAGGTITQSLVVSGLSDSGTDVSRSCGVTTGSVTISSIGEGLSGNNEIDFGDDGGPTCAGNTVHGSLSLVGNTAETEVDLNTVDANLTVSSNTGPVDLSGNKVGGNLRCMNPVVEGIPNLPKDDEAPNVVAGIFACQIDTTP